MKQGILYALFIVGFVLLFPCLLYADTVLGTAQLKDTILLPGSNVRKLIDKDRLKEIESALERKEHPRTAKKKHRIKKVEIVRVIPRSGNNPFNTREPINNTTLPSGQVVYRAVDEPESTAGDTGGGTGPCAGDGTLQNCVKTVSMHVIFPGPPTTIYGANFDIDPCTLECRTPPPGVAGQGAFSITYTAGDPMNTQYCAGSAADPNSAWELRAGGHCNGYTPGQVVEFVAVSNKGRLLKVSFKVDTSISPPVLQLLSLTPLN